jgi:hypothetical protein
MQYWAFAIPREEINDRLSQVTAVLLALLAFVFIMTSFVPKLTFLTKLDHAVTLLLFSIFLNGWSFVLFYRCGELRIGNWDIDTVERNYVIVAAVFNAIAFLYIFVPAALLHWLIRQDLDNAVPGTATMDPSYQYSVLESRPAQEIQQAKKVRRLSVLQRRLAPAVKDEVNKRLSRAGVGSSMKRIPASTKSPPRTRLFS